MFDRSGRHLRTIDSLTRATVLSFGYDGRGRLTSIKDGDNDTTTIQRDANGAPTAIVGPYGQTTTLASANGYLSRIENPAGNRILLEYSAGGLLSKLTDARDGEPHVRVRHARAPDADTDGRRLVADAGAHRQRRRDDRGPQVGREPHATYTVERTADGAIRRTVVNGAGQKTETLVGNDGVITVKHPDGTIATQESGPDPRFGMQAPIVQRMTVTTPGGTRTTMEGSRSVELTNPVDVLSLKSLTETATVNGKTKTTRYDAASRRFTTSSSLGRTATSEVDLLGRPLRTDAADVAPTLNTYDARGRLKSSTQGTRSTTLTYDTRGRIASVTDGLQRATEYTYDLADRVATIKHPDGRLVAFTYDAAGNRLSVTPPGKGAHTFAYTSRGSVDRYAPPSLLGGTKSTPTTYTADKDGLITGVNQPGGQSIAFAYDTVGRLATVTQPTGTTRHEYDSATGQMTSAVAPGGERASYEYDGALPTKLTLAGSAAGTITIGYDNNLRPATETVAGTAAVSLLYDDDGLVTRVGGLNLDRDPDSGRVQSMTARRHGDDARPLHVWAGGDRHHQARLDHDLRRDLRVRQQRPDHEPPAGARNDLRALRVHVRQRRPPLPGAPRRRAACDLQLRHQRQPHPGRACG